MLDSKHIDPRDAFHSSAEGTVCRGRRRELVAMGRVLRQDTRSKWPKKRSSERTCKPGLVPPRCGSDGHLSRRPIARPLQQSTRESIADRTSPRGRQPNEVGRRGRCSLFDLAPGGVCLAKPVTRPAGELLPHRFTLTARAGCPRGGLLSVALSLASRPVGVTHHRVLRSPDFPPVGFLIGRYGGPRDSNRRPSGPLRTPAISIRNRRARGKPHKAATAGRARWSRKVGQLGWLAAKRSGAPDP